MLRIVCVASGAPHEQTTAHQFAGRELSGKPQLGTRTDLVYEVTRSANGKPPDCSAQNAPRLT